MACPQVQWQMLRLLLVFLCMSSGYQGDLQQIFWGSIPSLTLLHPWLLLLLFPMAVMSVAART